MPAKVHKNPQTIGIDDITATSGSFANNAARLEKIMAILAKGGAVTTGTGPDGEGPQIRRSPARAAGYHNPATSIGKGVVQAIENTLGKHFGMLGGFLRNMAQYNKDKKVQKEIAEKLKNELQGIRNEINKTARAQSEKKESGLEKRVGDVEDWIILGDWRDNQEDKDEETAELLGGDVKNLMTEAAGFGAGGLEQLHPVGALVKQAAEAFIDAVLEGHKTFKEAQRTAMNVVAAMGDTGGTYGMAASRLTGQIMAAELIWGMEPGEFQTQATQGFLKGMVGSHDELLGDQFDGVGYVEALKGAAFRTGLDPNMIADTAQALARLGAVAVNDSITAVRDLAARTRATGRVTEEGLKDYQEVLTAMRPYGWGLQQSAALVDHFAYELSVGIVTLSDLTQLGQGIDAGQALSGRRAAIGQLSVDRFMSDDGTVDMGELRTAFGSVGEDVVQNIAVFLPRLAEAGPMGMQALIREATESGDPAAIALAAAAAEQYAMEQIESQGLDTATEEGRAAYLEMLAAFQEQFGLPSGITLESAEALHEAAKMMTSQEALLRNSSQALLDASDILGGRKDSLKDAFLDYVEAYNTTMDIQSRLDRMGQIVQLGLYKWVLDIGNWFVVTFSNDEDYIREHKEIYEAQMYSFTQMGLEFQKITHQMDATGRQMGDLPFLTGMLNFFDISAKEVLDVIPYDEGIRNTILEASEKAGHFTIGDDPSKELEIVGRDMMWVGIIQREDELKAFREEKAREILKQRGHDSGTVAFELTYTTPWGDEHTEIYTHQVGNPGPDAPTITVPRMTIDITQAYSVPTTTVSPIILREAQSEID